MNQPHVDHAVPLPGEGEPVQRRMPRSRSSATDAPAPPATRETGSPTRSARPSRWIAVAAVVSALVVGGLGATTAAAPAGAGFGGGHAGDVQESLDGLVADGGFPAALASIRHGRHVDNLTAGVGDLATGAPVPVDGYVRIGSNTKTFTAVVVLELVGEGLVELDEPVETYLPGLLRGDGIDGHDITVRQLLQHTSGLPDYTEIFSGGILPYQHRYIQPTHLVELALEHPAEFAPGEAWGYSNTNYAVAGLLIEQVTGRPVIEEITERTIEPLGLRRTYFPNVGDEEVRRPRPHGYHRDEEAQPLVEVTTFDPSFGWAAGQMVSTPSDLGRFFTALLDGRLLGPDLLAEMRHTVAAPELDAVLPGARYGLGILSVPLTCGGLAWGHGGDIPGYHTANGATDDGRSAVIAVTRLPGDLDEIAGVVETLDTALCS